jgi:hypothetical protein
LCIKKSLTENIKEHMAFMGTTLCWMSGKTSPEISVALRVLAEEYPVRENAAGGRFLNFKKGTGLDVSISNDSIAVTYDSLSAALRGVGFALAGEEVHGERNAFDTFGVMLTFPGTRS